MARYSENFDPLLLEGMTATLFGSDFPDGGLNIECIAVAALPERMNDFGALTAATWNNDQQDTDLELGPMELGQYRMRLLEDMYLVLKNPAPVEITRTKAAQFYLPQFPQGDSEGFLKEYFWRASEFFVWEDTTPRFNLYSSLVTTVARVLFSGWKFKVRRITTAGKISIWVNSWPASK